MSALSPKTDSTPLRPSGMAVQAPETTRTPTSALMYVAAFLVTASGLYAVRIFLENTPFTNLIYGLTALGFIVSYISRQQNIPARNVDIPAFIIGGCVFLTAFVSDRPFLAPSVGADDRFASLAILLTWLTVFFSFTLITDARLVFCCVPAIALIGLICTNRTEGDLLTAFLVFVCAGAFLLVHENFMRTRAAQPVYTHRAAQPWMYGSQFQLTGVCVAGAVILANYLVTPMRAVGSQLGWAAGLTSLAHTISTTAVPALLRVSEQQHVEIGTGPVRLSNQVLLRVKADQPAYWRGTSFDHYTGHGWQNSLPSNAPIPTDDKEGTKDNTANPDFGTAPSPLAFKVPQSAINTVGAAHHVMHQTITLQNGAFTELYAASEPRTVKLTEPRVLMDAAGTIHLPEATQNFTYEVDSVVADASEDRLRAAAARYPREIRQKYLQLPPNPDVVSRLRSEAEAATAGLHTPYDRVEALERWVGRQCKYNLNAPAVPAGQDVVDYFLNTGRQGYCDSFAAALVLLCRSLGIPARAASGFLQGERDDVTGQFVVRERDKHQWTEVYFGGVGWVKFDATEFAEDITDSMAAKNDRKNTLFGMLFRRGLLPPLVLLGFLCMLAYVFKVEVWDRFRPRRSLVKTLDLPATNLAVVSAYEAACGALSRRGLARPPSDTPLEFERKARVSLSTHPDARSAFEDLTRLVIHCRYSREVASAEHVKMAEIAAQSLQQSLRRVRRRDLPWFDPTGGPMEA